MRDVVCLIHLSLLYTKGDYKAIADKIGVIYCKDIKDMLMNNKIDILVVCTR